MLASAISLNTRAVFDVRCRIECSTVEASAAIARRNRRQPQPALPGNLVCQ